MRVTTFIGIACAGLLLAGRASAQQPDQRPHVTPQHGMQDSMGTRMGMMSPGMMPDAGQARLDSLVEAMNRATGSKKVPAMAAVINELVAQRRAVYQRMQAMHEHMGEMTGPTAGQAPHDSAPAKPAPADTTGHAEHHQE